MVMNEKIPGPISCAALQAGEGYAGEQGSQGDGPRVRLNFGGPRHRLDPEVVGVGVFILAIDGEKDEQPKEIADNTKDYRAEDRPGEHHAARSVGAYSAMKARTLRAVDILTSRPARSCETKGLSPIASSPKRLSARP